MKTRKCEWCEGPHLTARCVQHCQHCQKTYEECECAWRIMQAGLPVATYHDGINLRYIKSYLEAPWSVVMEIGHQTTTEQIREAIPAFLAIRDCLLRFQGPEMDKELDLIKRLEFLNAGGDKWSYIDEKLSNADLAKLLNGEILENLRVFLNPYIHDDVKYYKKQTSEQLLSQIGFSSEEAEATVSRLIQHLKDGNEIDTTVFPIDQDQVMNKLRNVKRSKAYKAWKALEG